MSWQITPLALLEAITDPDPAAAKRAFDAMMKMKKIDIAAIEAAPRLGRIFTTCWAVRPPRKSSGRVTTFSHDRALDSTLNTSWNDE